MATQTDQDIVDRLPLKQGAGFGALSFLVGYITTLGIVAAVEDDEFTDDIIELSGIIYYNAQLADAEISVTGTDDDIGFGILFEGTTINYVTDEQILGEELLEMPSVVYHLIPILSLILFGFLLARYVGAQTTQEGALAGGTVVLGVVPLTLIGVVLFTFEEESAELAPALSDSILFVGVLFPLIFGAIGGALSARLARRSDGTERSRR